MALPVLLLGKSGSGKTASLRNFKDDEVTLINVISKPLPFKNKWKYIINTDSVATIKQAINKTPTNIIVIDDAGYLMTNKFMANHVNNKGFELYNTIADEFWGLIEYVKTLDANKIVYFIMHEEKNEMGDIKPKTLGKLLDSSVCIEGMFTIAIRSTISNSKYVFRTNSDSLDVCKSPMGMFDSLEIDNDLKAVDEIIRDYYDMNDKEEKLQKMRKEEK